MSNGVLWDWLTSDVPETVEKRQNLIRAIIPGYIQEGYTQTAAKQELRDNGFSFGNNFFSIAWNSAESGFQAAARIKILNENNQIFPQILAQWDNPDTLHNDYGFRIRAAYYDMQNNEISHRTHFFGNDVLGTKGQLEGEIFHYLIERYPIEDSIIVNFEIESGYRRGGF